MLTLPYTFAGLAPVAPRKAVVHVLPVAYDGTTSFQSGARFGPSEIIMASRFLEMYDEFSDADPSSEGILTMPEIWPSAASPRRAISEIRQKTAGIIRRDRFPVLLGGEHTITRAAIEAVKEKHDDVSLLILDAHSDLRPEYGGTRFNHACTSRLCLELGLAVNIIGVRSLPPEDPSITGAERWPGELSRLRLVRAEEMRKIKPEKWLSLLSGNLSGKIYLSVDLDYFDPAFVPAVGTPEPGGFDLPDTSIFLRELACGHQLVGFDIVELNGSLRHVPSAYFAARLAWRILALFSPGITSTGPAMENA